MSSKGGVVWIQLQGAETTSLQMKLTTSYVVPSPRSLLTDPDIIQTIPIQTSVNIANA